MVYIDILSDTWRLKVVVDIMCGKRLVLKKNIKNNVTTIDFVL